MEDETFHKEVLISLHEIETDNSMVKCIGKLKAFRPPGTFLLLLITKGYFSNQLHYTLSILS